MLGQAMALKINSKPLDKEEEAKQIKEHMTAELENAMKGYRWQKVIKLSWSWSDPDPKTKYCLCEHLEDGSDCDTNAEMWGCHNGYEDELRSYTPMADFLTSVYPEVRTQLLKEQCKECTSHFCVRPDEYDQEATGTWQPEQCCQKGPIHESTPDVESHPPEVDECRSEVIKAATKIQAVVRGNAGRAQAKKLREEKAEEE